MADDEWEDTLVTSWTYPDKQAAFYASQIKSKSLLANDQDPHRTLTGVLAPTRPTGFLTILYGTDESFGTKEVHRILHLDHQNIMGIGNFFQSEIKHPVIPFKSKYVLGQLSAGGNPSLLVDSEGKLHFGGHTVNVRLDEYKLQRSQRVPEWVDHYRWDSHGVVYIDGVSNQLKELRGTEIVKYPTLKCLRGFATTDTHVFAVTSDKGCQLTKFDRSDPTKFTPRDLFAFTTQQFECVQAYKQYVLICFKNKEGEQTLVEKNRDHHLLMYRTSDLSFMQKLTFSGCGFLPRKLHTKNTWEFLRKQKKSNNNQHVPEQASYLQFDKSIDPTEQHLLRSRGISKFEAATYSMMQEMIIFPFDGDDRLLVVALRSRGTGLYLISISKGKLFQCDALRLFQSCYADRDRQCRIFPRPDFKGVIAVANNCKIDNFFLTKYTLSA